MAFFKRKEKKLARTKSRTQLQQHYEETERQLHAATRSGKVKPIKKAMQEHRTAEYALLYQSMEKHRKRGK